MNDVAKLLWFSYRQNNSGGVFCKPAITVYIQANNASEANDIAEIHGLYFGGHGDCPCCGNRWYSQYDNSDGEHQLIFEKNDFSWNDSWAKSDDVPVMMLVPYGKEPLTFQTSDDLFKKDQCVLTFSESVVQ